MQARTAQYFTEISLTIFHQKEATRESQRGLGEGPASRTAAGPGEIFPCDRWPPGRVQSQPAWCCHIQPGERTHTREHSALARVASQWNSRVPAWSGLLECSGQAVTPYICKQARSRERLGLHACHLCTLFAHLILMFFFSAIYVLYIGIGCRVA